MIIFLQLFLTFFQIGLLGFGGGYAMLSMIQGEVVTKYQWLTTGEFTDIVAISQMTPGPIGINSATYAEKPVFPKTPVDKPLPFPLKERVIPDIIPSALSKVKLHTCHCRCHQDLPGRMQNGAFTHHCRPQVKIY